MNPRVPEPSFLGERDDSVLAGAGQSHVAQPSLLVQSLEADRRRVNAHIQTNRQTDRQTSNTGNGTGRRVMIAAHVLRIGSSRV